MDKYPPIVLDYPFHKSAVVNDFLRATGLDKNFRVVLAEIDNIVDTYDDYYYHPARPLDEGLVIKRGGPEIDRSKLKIMRVGLEPLDKETDFYWSLKGHDTLRAAVADYIASRPFNKGVS